MTARRNDVLKCGLRASLKGQAMKARGLCLYRTRDVLPRNRQRTTWASASRSLSNSTYRPSASVGAWSMTDLTWMRGSTSIRTEGGPERKLYGP